MVVGLMTHLAKLHATANDFLVTTDEAAAPRAAALCDRARGVGADGLIVLTPGGDGADATMTLLNADGGLAEMSGNGVRCLAWVARRAGLGTAETLVVDTGGGRRPLALTCDATGDVVHAVCDMGPVTFVAESIPVLGPTRDLTAAVDGVEYRGDAAGIGNPHWVCFVDDPARVPLARIGPVLEHDHRFPARTNVEVVRVDGARALTMRVWERGVGETLSCGTGACAAAAVAHERGLVGEQVAVWVPGGRLDVDLGPTVRLGGPVVHVFDVDLDLDAFGAGEDR
jgi:diaminopimelate epimerase